MVSWALASLVVVEIILVSGKSVFSAGSSPSYLKVQTGVGSHVAKSPISSTKPTDSDSLTSTSSSETAESTDSSSSTKADPKIRQGKHDSSSVKLVAVVGVIIFGLAAIAIFVAVYCYIRVSRSKKAADHQETRVLNSTRKGTQVQEFSSESL